MPGNSSAGLMTAMAALPPNGYDADSYLTDVTADDHTLHYDYDADRRITHVAEDGIDLRFHYDPNGRVDQVIFPGNGGYRITYAVDKVKVEGPGADCSVDVRNGFFHITH